MHRVPQAGPWWPAVDAPVERGVRHPCTPLARRVILHANDSASLAALRQEQSRYPASAARAEGFAWRSAPCIGAHRLASSFPEAPSRLGWLTFCCLQRFSLFERALSIRLEARNSVSLHLHVVQFGSICCGAFPLLGEPTVLHSLLATCESFRRRHHARRLCRFVAVPPTPTGALPVGPAAPHFSDA
jgi:hypothetical protein